MPNFDPQALGLQPEIAGYNPSSLETGEANTQQQVGWSKALPGGRTQHYDMQGNDLGISADKSTFESLKPLLAMAGIATGMGGLAGAGPLGGMLGGDAAAVGAGAGDAGAGLGWMGGADGVGAGTMGDALAMGMGAPLPAGGAGAALSQNALPSLAAPTIADGLTAGGAFPAAAAGYGGVTGALTAPAAASAGTGLVATLTETLGISSAAAEKLITGLGVTGAAALISGGAGGGGGGGAGGAVTDPAALIAAQGKENRDTFQYMLDNSRVGASNPYGSSNWVKGADGKWTNNQTFNPATQGIFDSATSGLGDAVKALPTNGMDAYNQAVADALYKRSRLYQDPADALARNSMQSNLADRGFQVGNAGYNTEMTRLDDSQGRGRADSAYQATLAGGAEGRANINTQTGIINALSGVRSAQSNGLMGLPSTSATPSLQPTDITGINQNAANNALDASNASAYGKSQMFGNLLNFGASIFGSGGKGAGIWG